MSNKKEFPISTVENFRGEREEAVVSHNVTA